MKVNHKSLNDEKISNDQWESVAFSYLYSYISYRFTHTNNRQRRRERERKKEISRLQGYFKWTHSHIHMHVFVGRQIVLSLLKKQIFFKWLDIEEEKLRRSFHLNIKQIFKKMSYSCLFSINEFNVFWQKERIDLSNFNSYLQSLNSDPNNFPFRFE